MTPTRVVADGPDLEVRLPRPVRYELVRTLSPLRHGNGDPTIRLEAGRAIRATRTPVGPATLEVREAGHELVVRAWGPGAAWAVEQAPGPARAQRRSIGARRAGAAASPGRGARPSVRRGPAPAQRSGRRGPGPGRPRAEDHRRGSSAGLPAAHPGPRRARARSVRAAPPAHARATGRPALPRLSPARARAPAGRDPQADRRAGGAPRGGGEPADRRGPPAAGRGPGHRPVDGRRGGPLRPRRSRRGQRRRLPPAEPGRVRPGRRAARRRRAGCSRSWSPIAASAAGWSACSRRAASGRRDAVPGWRRAPSPGSRRRDRLPEEARSTAGGCPR